MQKSSRRLKSKSFLLALAIAISILVVVGLYLLFSGPRYPRVSLQGKVKSTYIYYADSGENLQLDPSTPDGETLVRICEDILTWGIYRDPAGGQLLPYIMMEEEFEKVKNTGTYVYLALYQKYQFEIYYHGDSPSDVEADGFYFFKEAEGIYFEECEPFMTSDKPEMMGWSRWPILSDSESYQEFLNKINEMR